MAPKKTNIKIKRSKFNLYNKKKSKAKRALKVILSIVVICGLGVLGYGLGKPLMKYFRERGNNDSNNASAIVSSMINSATAGFTHSTAQSSAPPVTTAEEEPPKPTLVSTAKIYYLPDDAAANKDTLAKALAQAKQSGCTIVAVTMKDEKGCLQYKTAIEKLKGTDAVRLNPMTAQEIASAVAKEGFTPAARINTLLDQLGCYYMSAHYQFTPEQGGYVWHDNTEEKGGKPWMSPFKDESRSYIAEITKELTNAGFNHIICANTRFPAFHSVDITNYLNYLPLSDEEKRADALWSIIDAAKAKTDNSGANLWIEISGTNLIADNKSCTDAEIVSRTEKLRDMNIAVIYDVKGTLKPNGENTSASSTSDAQAAAPSAYNTAKTFAKAAKAALGGTEFAVRIPDTVTGRDLTDIKRALSEEGIAVF